MRHAIAVFLFAMAGLLQAGAVKAETRWDLYTIVGVNHPVAVQLQQFSDEVRRRSGGDLVITIRPAGELPFKATEVVKITGDGQVQLGEALASFTVGTVPLVGVTGLPLFLSSADDMRKALPIVRRAVSKDFEKQGAKVLFQFLWPFAQIYGSGKPIRSPSDFAGRKLRVLSPMGAEMLKRLGATSVSLTTAEVPVAFDRGTIEGVISTAYTMVGSKWAEMAKWGYESAFNGVDDYVIVNIAAYNKLSPKTRATLDEVAQEWGPKMSTASFHAETESRNLLLSRYKYEIVTATKADNDRMTALMKDYWSEWAKATGPDAAKLLDEVRAAVGK